MTQRWIKRLAYAVLFLSVASSMLSGQLSPSVPVVQTANGAVSGRRGAVESFFGIPYAQPPVGPLRWRPPQPAAAWKGVRDATKFGADCMQVREAQSRSDGINEDCLTLNIWTPKASRQTSLPVMLWVYGGGFTAGSGSLPIYDGEALSKQSMVVVTFNYRVGMFGFLAHPELTEESPHHASGNYGLLDMLAAFQWVKANIATFGGDPNRITVFGESAGASSLSLLLGSPLATGLFQRTILESPGAMRALSTLEAAEKQGEALGSDLESMRQVPASEVLAWNGRMVLAVRSITSPRALGPIADGWVLPSDERRAFAERRMLKVPLLLGGNAEEGRLFVANYPIKTVAAYRDYVQQNFKSDGAEALALYPANTDAEVQPALRELFADAQFHQGIRGMARGMAAQGAPVYAYHFTKSKGEQGTAPTHGDEIPYVFGNVASGEQGFDVTDQRVSQVMSAAWVNFARTGNPNVPGVLPWPRYRRPLGKYVEFGVTPKIKSGFEADRLDFFDRFFAKAASH